MGWVLFFIFFFFFESQSELHESFIGDSDLACKITNQRGAAVCDVNKDQMNMK